MTLNRAAVENRVWMNQCKVLVERGSALSGKRVHLVAADTRRNQHRNIELTAATEKGLIFSKNSYLVYAPSCECYACDTPTQDAIPKWRTLSDSQLAQMKSAKNHTLANKSSNKRLQVVGRVENPGLLFDKSTVRAANGGVVAALKYECTSRRGELMKMRVSLPKIEKLATNKLAAIIEKCTGIPLDCARLLCKFLAKDSHSWYAQSAPERLQISNASPVWNDASEAYTLEFGGRALIPSVYNFQMHFEERIVLQLGKVSDEEFNLDFSYPFSTFQAFGICLSVLSRTFVWD